MSKFYSTRKFAKTRIRWSSGTQKEVTVENLLTYQNSSALYFGYNSNVNYNGPESKNSENMSPYIFLGFLPISLARNKNTQGYRAAGVDYTFKNSDSNPNSYITFYYNPNNAYPGRAGKSKTFMTGWIDRSSLLAASKTMSADFYFDWEMHMGGGGGFMTSQSVSNTRAALGLPFGSCQEIYQANNRYQSGEYTVYHNDKSIRVYCSFEENWGYTYISKASHGTSVNISKLYSTRKFAKTRIRWSSGTQKEKTCYHIKAFLLFTSAITVMRITKDQILQM
ncbi:unnamed protein product [Mytilus coruscus]|uniref:GON domain-containing protein n=1 Tax=Mytilus coruscus TaxID=42192 RepID=A0A6J8C0M4_MYTCO|nr:unnamed protein product [Mytilus coruscus]